MLDTNGKYGTAPASVCRLVEEWIGRPEKKASMSGVTDEQRSKLLYDVNMSAANAILRFPRPTQGAARRPARAASNKTSSRLRLTDFLHDQQRTIELGTYASELGYTVTRDRVPVTQSEGTCGFNSARAACVLRMGKDDGRWSYTTSVFHAVDEQWVREGFGSILRLDRDRSPWLSESEIAALVTRWNPDNGADRSDPLTAPLFSLHENGYQQRAAPALWVTIDTLDSFVRRIAEDAHTNTPIPLNNPAIAIVNLGDSRTRGWHWICAAWSRGGV